MEYIEKETAQEGIEKVCNGMARLLSEKNKRYGNSALEPLRVFSRADAADGIMVRLDDKLSRIKNSDKLRKNDISDLIGYLVLLCIAQGWTDFDDLID
ncbi:MAG: hypothetical protein BWY95_02715 [Bacteroidetes bacterium ADurb.BinA104]|nr:MAG: hypothetical protein BWY95_02715 [Bacteroidetes bacterium ADurb.BinA104]